MQKLNVNPNRMELRKVRSKLKTAEKGYNLLKNKTNELIGQFSGLIKQTKELRKEVESEFLSLITDYNYSKIKMSEKDLSIIFGLPSCGFKLDFNKTQGYGTTIPKVLVEKCEYDLNLPYSPIGKRAMLDYVVKNFYEFFPKLVSLAETEKSAMLVAQEIEKCKRRVNALENILLPKYRETIEMIELKLMEDERANLSRLLKVKSIINSR